MRGSGSSGPDVALELRDLPPKAWTVSLPIIIHGPSICLSPEVPMNWGRVGVLRPPAVPSVPSTSGRGIKVQRGWKTCLQLWAPRYPPHTLPCTDEETTDPWGRTGCGPWGVPLLLGVPTAMGPQQGGGPSVHLALMSPGRAQEASQHTSDVSPLFLPGLTACSKGGTPVLVLSQPRTAWFQLGLRDLFSQSPPEMEFTSHLWSVHKLLQSTYCVPGIGVTEQKYTHDSGKPIFCRSLKNSDSAECGHQMLIINHFLKEEIWE